MFIAALLIITKDWKYKCPSTGEQINQLQNTLQCMVPRNREDKLLQTPQVNVSSIMLSEKKQTQTAIFYFPFVRSSRKGKVTVMRKQKSICLGLRVGKDLLKTDMRKLGMTKIFYIIIVVICGLHLSKLMGLHT